MKKFVVIFLFILGFAPVCFAQAPKIREISIIAKQFEFLPGTIVVEKGVPVRFYLTSVDTSHGIFVSEFKINKRVEKGQLSVVEFTPDKTGTFDIKCSVFCGIGHHSMVGKIVVK